MVKSRFLKSLILGVCIVVASSTTAFAETGSGGTDAAEPAKVTIADERIQEVQKKIDQFFEQNKEEIAKKGFSLVYTVPLADTVEVGIAPYNEENAAYIYDVLGKDSIKVIDGQPAVLRTGAPDSPDLSVTTTVVTPEVSEELLNKLKEVEKYVFETHKDDIIKSGFNITYTALNGDFVEVGIMPFTKENADYIYKEFGSDTVKVVEGEQAVIMELGANSDNKAAIKVTSANGEKARDLGKSAPARTNTLPYTLGAAMLMGGTFLVIRKIGLKR